MLCSLLLAAVRQNRSGFRSSNRIALSLDTGHRTQAIQVKLLLLTYMQLKRTVEQ